MSFLKNIFKKKEGGTFLGNVFRSAASSVSGGVFGTGKGIIPIGTAANAAAVAGDTATYEKEMAKLKDKSPTVWSQLLGVFGTHAVNTPQGQEAVQDIAGSTIKKGVASYLGYIIAAAIGVYLLFIKKDKSGFSKGYGAYLDYDQRRTIKKYRARNK